MVPASSSRGRDRREDRGPLVVTPGDPDGVGPEVTLGALAAAPRDDVVIVGDRVALMPWAERAGVTLQAVDAVRTVPGALAVLDPGDVDEPVEVASIRVAVQACLDGGARAMVTGPIHKAKLARRGFEHPGHTDFIAALCGVPRPVMAFVGGRVRVALVTVHLPLADVSERLSTEAVVHTVRTAHAALRDQLGLEHPRLVVCGLNPHAGDEGLLGTEDAELVAPAVAAARGEGIDAVGPVSVEGAFRLAVQGGADLVVAMYHDQGLGPLKALEAARVADRGALSERAVNWTLGLPIVRTSVDHGTAYDIAGQGVADPGSLLSALALADRLTS